MGIGKFNIRENKISKYITAGIYVNKRMQIFTKVNPLKGILYTPEFKTKGRGIRLIDYDKGFLGKYWNFFFDNNMCYRYGGKKGGGRDLYITNYMEVKKEGDVIYILQII